MTVEKQGRHVLAWLFSSACGHTHPSNLLYSVFFFFFCSYELDDAQRRAAAMRPLTLHVSALSDSEYDLYTTSLNDLDSTDSNTNIPSTTHVRDDAHYERTSVGAREARAWLRGRHSDLPASDIDAVSSGFPLNPSNQLTPASFAFLDPCRSSNYFVPICCPQIRSQVANFLLHFVSSYMPSRVKGLTERSRSFRVSGFLLYLDQRPGINVLSYPTRTQHGLLITSPYSISESS